VSVRRSSPVFESVNAWVASFHSSLKEVDWAIEDAVFFLGLEAAFFFGVDESLLQAFESEV